MDTITYQKARPLQSNVDLSGASLKHVMDGYEDMRQGLEANDGGIMANPETDALWFYVQQHAMGLVERNLDADEPMGKYEPFVIKYHDMIQQKALRMFYYILLICTRESRHMGGNGQKAKLWGKYPNIQSFHANYVQDSSADSAVKAIMNNAPDITLGEYTSFLVHAFTIPSYGGGYGGDAWAEIARPLSDFVHGKISAELLMDTAFTLAHNNGPIFNKGMLYHGYNSTAVQKILDVQRSGQIPQLIANSNTSGSGLANFITSEMLEYVADFTRLDAGFSGTVDWTQVKNIHGSACWHNEIAAMKTADEGLSIIEKFKEKAAKLKAQAAKLALLKGSIQISPGVHIAKGKRSIK